MPGSGATPSRDQDRKRRAVVAPMSGWRLFWCLLAAPFLIIFGIWIVLLAWNHTGPDMPVERHAERTLAWKGSDVLVGLTIAAEAEEEPPPLEITPRAVDLMVCLDVSGSMGDLRDPGSPLSHAVGTLRSLFAIFASPDRRVGVLQFESSPTVLSGPTSDADEFSAALARMTDGGSTDIESALRAGLDLLGDPASTAPADRFLVLISDGNDPNVEGCREVMRVAAERGVTCAGIGVGFTSSTQFFEDVFEYPHLNLGAYGDPRHLAPLIIGFVGQHELMPVGGWNAGLREPVNSAAFDPDPLDDPFFVDATDLGAGTEQLRWELPLLAADPHDVTYSVRPTRIGVNRIATGPASLDYSRSHGPAGDRHAESSGRPALLIISPWLILWLFLPCLLWLLWLLSHRVPRLHIPEDVGPPGIPVPRLTPVPHIEVPHVQQTPTLAVGIGGPGGEALAHLKHNLREMARDADPLRIRLLAVDTDRQRGAPEAFGAALDAGEVLHVPSEPDLAGFVVDVDTHPQEHPYLANWFRAGERRSLPDARNSMREGAQGDRRLARAGFLRSLKQDDASIRRLKEVLAEFAEDERDFQILVVASVDGGTGSGLLFDVAGALRCWCRDLDLVRMPSVVAFLSSGAPDPDTAPNVRATLEELERFQSVRSLPFELPDLHMAGPWDGSVVSLDAPVFDRWYTFDPGEGPALVADAMFLYCERSQRQTMEEILHDADVRLRREGLADGHPRGSLLELKSIRFDLIALIERLRLRGLMGLLNQVCDVSAVERPPDERPVEWAARPPAFWDGAGLYKDMDAKCDSATLKAWHSFLVTGEGGAPPPGNASNLNLFFSRALQVFLNGLVVGEREDAVSDAIRGRQNRLMEIEAFLRRAVERGKELDRACPPDAAYASYLRELNVLHQELLDAVHGWLDILVGPAEPERAGDAEPFPGLYRWAQRRIGELREVEAELNALGHRVYVTDDVGNPELSEESLWSSLIVSAELESGALLSRLTWEVDEQGGIRVHFSGLAETRLDATPDAGPELLRAFADYFDGQVVPSLWEKTLAHKLQNGSVSIERELATHEGDVAYAILTVPDVRRWREFDDLRTRVRTRTAAGVHLSEARIGNPLWISKTVVRPDLRIDDLPAYSDAKRMSSRDISALPFVHHAEARSVLFADHVSRSRGERLPDGIHSAEVRPLFERSGAIKALTGLLVTGRLRPEPRGPLSAWGVDVEGRFLPLQEWGEPAWLESCLRLVVERFSWNGERIPDDVFRVNVADLDEGAVDELAKRSSRLARDAGLTVAECELWELIATECLLILEEKRGRT